MLFLIFVTGLIAADVVPPPCAYWCEAPCTKKVTSFYCCSFVPTLVGPTNLAPPPCTDLCANRTSNASVDKRNCKTEIDALKDAGSFKICRNFNDCNSTLHDLCCLDNCVPEKQKMCVKLD